MDALTSAQFTLMVLGFLATAAVLGSRGVERLASARTLHYQALARQAALSPIPYGVATPAAGRPLQGAVHAVIRADLAEDEAGTLCSLARHTAAVSDIGWVALSDRLPVCVAVARPVRPAGASADSLRALVNDARWWIVGAEGRILYSRREVPRPAELHRMLAALTPRPPAAPTP